MKRNTKTRRSRPRCHCKKLGIKCHCKKLGTKCRHKQTKKHTRKMHGGSLGFQQFSQVYGAGNVGFIQPQPTGGCNTGNCMV